MATTKLVEKECPCKNHTSNGKPRVGCGRCNGKGVYKDRVLVVYNRYAVNNSQKKKNLLK
jgi:hypothetical protein